MQSFLEYTFADSWFELEFSWFVCQPISQKNRIDEYSALCELAETDRSDSSDSKKFNRWDKISCQTLQSYRSQQTKTIRNLRPSFC